ncbi:MAG: A/G-specific adenine glycosylase, partial [Bacteroidota bacterium]
MNAHDWVFFRESILQWYQPDRRPMPWKGERDPYLVWLSEIILQQTRVEQGWTYFERFKENYPNIESLAAAEDKAVMKLWEGLGYYSRARNLLKAARVVVSEHKGQFPNTLSGLLSLPGIGPYTAAAIGSFAFNLPVPVVDGNVYRILSRFSADETPIDTTSGRKQFNKLAEAAFAKDQPARYNQAIMDFGALVCTPKRSQCNLCPLATKCMAKMAGKVYDLPIKSKKLKRRSRYFHYLVIRNHENQLLLSQRVEKDIWQELHQFILIETSKPDYDTSSLVLQKSWPAWLPPSSLTRRRTS